MASKMPMVVIVGRMNVGKSTLFNRLAENVKSITLDYPGVTRDIMKDKISWQDRTFELIDTGGISLRKQEDKLLEQVRMKALALVDEAAVVIFVVDGVAGVTPEDREIAQILRERDKKTLLVVNKSDVKAFEDHLYDFYDLYQSTLIPLSAEHGLGIGELLNEVVTALPTGGTSAAQQPKFRVVFLGRPNVGKSSLMNALLEQDRSIVSDIPGTTREALSENIMFYQEHIQITDTAGIRRKRAVDENLEQLMVKSSFRAMKDADIVVLMMDAGEAGIVDQELKLAFYAFEEQYKAFILLINKSDLLDERKEYELERSFAEYEHLTSKIPILRISCKTGKNIGRVLGLIKQVWERHNQQLPADELNELVVNRVRRTPLMHAGKKLDVYKVKQLRAAPITIGLQVNYPEWFGPSQLRFFENIVRKQYDLIGAPLKFITRKKL